ncbi:YppE family protein [Alkalicoccus chagannorensis]|uniref:YppE family protein n=1 Tax=Alkalicoccus chagannorensis TaxID=427072 RepID=UPI000424D89B|nr:YppE family protein [Alkalicoccus chagannorensis]
MSTYSRLIELTVELKKKTDEAKTYFERHRLGGEEADFYQDVKPFADSVRQTVEEWEPLVRSMIQTEKPAYLHEQQIDTMLENMEMAAVTCFQQDTKKKRFQERYKSIHYTLSMVEQAVEA